MDPDSDDQASDGGYNVDTTDYGTGILDTAKQWLGLDDGTKTVVRNDYVYQDGSVSSTDEDSGLRTIVHPAGRGFETLDEHGYVERQAGDGTYEYRDEDGTWWVDRPDGTRSHRAADGSSIQESAHE